MLDFDAIKNFSIDKSDWQKVKFGDVVYEPKESVKDPVTEGIKHVVGLEHIDCEEMHLCRSASIEESTTFTKKFSIGDVLFGRRRAYLKKAAKASFEGICSGDITVFRAKEELLFPELLPFIVNNDNFFDHAVTHSAGGLSPRVKFKDLSNFEFYLPSKEEQKRLLTLLNTIEKLAVSKKELLNKAKVMFDSYSKYYFKTQAKEFIPLGSCAEIIMGQSPAGDSYNKDGNGSPLINGPTEFTDRYPIKVQWTNKPTKFCQINDILLCVRGSTTGRMNISNDEYCIGRGVAAIRGKGDFKTEFLEFALRYYVIEILRVASGSTFPNIDSKSLKGIPLPNLNDNAQNEVINKLKIIDKTVDELVNDIQKTNFLKKNLVSKVF
jgi:type I restriction enzyme S subunit